MENRSDAGTAEAQVLAGIVTYHPDLGHLAELVGAVARDVREVVVYANSDIAAAAEAILRQAAGATPLRVVRPGRNDGLGTAYNALVAMAARADDAFVFLLDQDSLPRFGTIPELIAATRRLQDAGERPAVVGPYTHGADGLPMKVRASQPTHYAVTRTRRTEHVISSGSLIGVAAARAVGPFREDYFIDAIDIEWCMRANAGDHSVWIADEAHMDHRLGQGLVRLPFGLRVTRQPPLRLYTFVRNQLEMARLPHVPLAHKLRTLAKLPIWIVLWLAQARSARETATAIRRGLADGLSRRLGPPQGRLDER